MLVSCVMQYLTGIGHHVLIVIFVTVTGKFCMPYAIYVFVGLGVMITWSWIRTNVVITNHDEENSNSKL